MAPKPEDTARWLRTGLHRRRNLFLPSSGHIVHGGKHFAVSANVRIYARAVPFSINPHRCAMPAHSGKLSPGQSSLLPLHSARHAAGVQVKPHPHRVPGGNRPPHRSAARRACRTSLLQTRSNTPHYRSSWSTKSGTATSTALSSAGFSGFWSRPTSSDSTSMGARSMAPCTSFAGNSSAS